MSQFKTKRKVLIPAEDGCAVMQVNTCYRARSGPGLLQMYSILVGSDTFGNFFQRTSEDNGRTWSDPAPTYLPETTSQGVLRQGEQSLFLDEEKGVVLQFYNLALYPQGHFTGDATRNTRIFMRRTRGDGGFSARSNSSRKGTTRRDGRRASSFEGTPRRYRSAPP